MKLHLLLLLGNADPLVQAVSFDLPSSFGHFLSNRSSDILLENKSLQSRNSFVKFNRLGTRGLIARQETCVPASYLPCPDGVSCCPAGDDCVSGGCCPAGEIPCGTTKCYNPDTEICCAGENGGCNKGEVCVAGGCCDVGEVLCGSETCYDPTEGFCCEDESHACRNGEDCVADGCCPEGEQECGSKCYDPTVATCCTGAGQIWGCQVPAECCEGNPGFCHQADEQCCDNGACPSDDTCCEKQCCKADIATCGGDGFCTPTTTSVSAAPSTTKAPVLSVTESLTTKFSVPPTTSAPKLSTPKLPSTSSSSTASSTTALPTLLFPYIPNLTDDLVENMCLGLRSQNAPVQSQVLTYGGNSDANRKQTGCKGGRCCTGQTKQSGSNAGMPLSCDEYPFASTVEGGSGAHVGCIVDWQNGLQGWYLSSFYRDYNLQVNDQFVMEITGIDCDEVKDSDIPGCNSFKKRDDGNITAGSGSQLFQSNSSDQNALIIPFGDLTPGQYSTRVKIPPSSTISNVSILDNTGYFYASTGSLISWSNLSTSGVDISWTLTDYEYGVSIVADTAETSLNATWQLAVNTSLPNNSASGGRNAICLTMVVAVVAVGLVTGW